MSKQQSAIIANPYPLTVTTCAPQTSNWIKKPLAVSFIHKADQLGLLRFFEAVENSGLAPISSQLYFPSLDALFHSCHKPTFRQQAKASLAPLTQPTLALCLSFLSLPFLV